MTELSPGARDIMEFLHRCRDKGIHEVPKAEIMRAMGVDESDIRPEDETALIYLTAKGTGDRIQ